MTYEEGRNVLLSLRMSMCKTEKESIDYLLDYIEKLKKDVKKARKEKKRWKRKYIDLKKINYLSFSDDEDKMKDFWNLSKENFLKLYSYLTEEEYDATAKEFKL